MIRVVTFDEFDPKMVKDLCKILYTSFAVGSEHSGTMPPPAGFNEPYDAGKLLEAAPAIRAFQDDKILYLTSRKLAPRKLFTGEAPTFGVSAYNAQRALLSTSTIKNVNENVKMVARFAMQELGHCFGVHHCLDPRCAMYPHWTPSFPAGEASFCVFCRDQVDQKVRVAKS